MPQFHVIADTDLASYWAAVSLWLASDPVRNNVLATLLAARATGGVPVEPDVLLVRVVDDHDLLCGVAIQTPPRGLIMSALPPAAAATLAEWCYRRRPHLPGANGPTAADEFAVAFEKLSRRKASVLMNQRMFELTQVIHPVGTPGSPRPATTVDRDLLVEWAIGFDRDTTPNRDHTGRGSREDMAAPVDLRLRSPNLLWLWTDEGEPTSVCWLSPPAAGVCRISGVYTPSEHRGRGYASANVAHASAYALTHLADRCMLYTDLANPTSNKIYQAMGYQPVADVKQWSFAADPRRIDG